MVHDPVERLTRRCTPPVNRDMLNPVRLPVARVNTVRVLIRRRLPGLNIGQVSDHQISAARTFLVGRTRVWGRCATAFSRQAHLGLSCCADLTVSRQAVRFLPRLDRLHRANANLPINVGTDNLLHGGMIKVALRLETVTGRAVYEMPVFAITPTLGPVPAVGLALTLHPFLDRAMMNVDSKSVTVIRQ